MTDGFEPTPDLIPHISLLPEVSSGVLNDIRDDDKHPAKEHWTHLTEEQTILARQLIIKANSRAIVRMNSAEAFLAGAMYTHEALHEQAARNLVKDLEVPPSPTKEVKIKPSRTLKFGAALMIFSRRQKYRHDIESA
jgi:hypothetical protein